MKWFVTVLAALLLIGCAKNIDNQEAVQKAVDEYFAQPKLSAMSARVQNVIFRGTEADATVMVTGKGAAPSSAVPIPYVLEKKSDHWVVRGPSKSGMAAHSQGGGQQLPAEHPTLEGAPKGQQPGQSPNLPPDHPPIGTK